MLQDHPELLTLPDPDPPSDFTVTDAMLAQVTALGFDAEAARATLYRLHDVERAAEELLSRGGVVPPQWLQDMLAAGASTSHRKCVIPVCVPHQREKIYLLFLSPSKGVGGEDIDVLFLSQARRLAAGYWLLGNQTQPRSTLHYCGLLP